MGLPALASAGRGLTYKHEAGTYVQDMNKQASLLQKFLEAPQTGLQAQYGQGEA